MKALSLWQPWATLVACGAKRVETRHWPCPRRMLGQTIALHAAKRPDELWAIDHDTFRAALLEHRAVPLDALDRLRMTLNRPNRRALPRRMVEALDGAVPLGYVLATMVVDRCSQITDERAAQLAPAERAFGNYEPGRFAWVLRDVKPLERPVKARGGQGFFDIDLSDLQAQGALPV